MSKLSDLRATRDAAGARFKAAVEEFHQAFVDLSALDQTLASGVAGEQLQTLGPPPDYWCLVHPKFAPFQGGNWNDEIQTRRDAYIAAATAAA